MTHTQRKARKTKHERGRKAAKTRVLATTPKKQEAEREAFVRDIVDRCLVEGFIVPAGTDAAGEQQYVLSVRGRALVGKALAHRTGITEDKLRQMSLAEVMAVMMRTSN